MRRTVTQSIVAALAAVTATAGLLALPAASAATPPRTGSLGQLVGTEGCVQDITGFTAGGLEGCASAQALKAAGSTAMTPDGSTVFVAGSTNGGSIDAFHRDTVSGVLSQIAGAAGCATATGAGGCTSIPELNGLASITLNHGGTRLFAAIPSAAKVLILSVGGDGTLSRPGGQTAPTGCIQNSVTPTATCSPGSGIPHPVATAVSDDDGTLYVSSGASGTTTGSVAAFDVSTGTPVNNAAPAFRSCVQGGTATQGCQSGDGLLNPGGIAVRGTTIYVASFGQSFNGAVTHIDDAGGVGPAGLSEKDCHGTLPNCTPARAVGGASDVVVSPDGLNVYVAHQDLSVNDGSIIGGGVALFIRAADGSLSQPAGSGGCVVETTVAADASCTHGRGLKGAGSLAVSPDNRNVYSAAALNNPAAANQANTGSSAIAVLDRDPSDTATAGILTQPAGTDGCLSALNNEGCAVVRGLVSPGSAPHSIILDPGPVGSFVYASGSTSQAVAAFGRQGSDLQISAVAQPGPYTVGQSYSITLTVFNGGALVAHNVTVSDVLSSGAAFTGVTPSSGTCTLNPTKCNLGTVPVGSSATVVVRFQPTASGTSVNTARVGADEGDAHPDNNIATTSLASGATTLAILSGGGQSAKVSTPFALPIKASLKDSSGAPLQGVQVTFTAPAAGATALFGGANTETVTTDAGGIATSSIPSANNTAGSYTVTISSPGAVAQTVSLTNNLTGPSPSPSPSATPTATTSPSSSPGPRQRVGLDLTSAGTITPGTPMTLSGFAQPGNAVTLRCYSRTPQNSQPGSGTPTYFDARNGVTSNAGTITFSLNPGTNTRCFLKYANVADSDTTVSNSVVQNVATALSLSAYRDGVRQYHFQGRNLPRRAGQLITLYRLDNSGREIRTATTTTDSTGIWRINRHFTGAGQFSFRARTSQTLTNVAGVSNTRLTVIH